MHLWFLLCCLGMWWLFSRLWSNSGDVTDLSFFFVVAFFCSLGSLKHRGTRWAPHGLCGGWVLLAGPDTRAELSRAELCRADLCWSRAVLLLQGQLFPPCLPSVISSSTPVLESAQLEHLLCWKAGLAEEWLNKKIKLKGGKLKWWTQSPVSADADTGRE